MASFKKHVIVFAFSMIQIGLSSNNQRIDTSKEAIRINSACRSAVSIARPVHLDVSEIALSAGLSSYENAIAAAFVLYFRILESTVISINVSYGMLENLDSGLANVNFCISAGDFL